MSVDGGLEWGFKEVDDISETGQAKAILGTVLHACNELA